LITGSNFPTNSIPMCKFGVPGSSAVTFGTVINNNMLSCSAPFAKIPSGAVEPYVVPFAVAFEDEEFDSLSLGNSGIHYQYYRQPEIKEVVPRQIPVDETLLVTITSTNERPFTHSIVGSNLDLDIICRFGRFGSTTGALIAHNQVGCPSPNTKVSLHEISEENVVLEISLNGQDFVKIPTSFKFIGTNAYPSGHGFTWVMAIAVGIATLIIILYLFGKHFIPTLENNSHNDKVPLAANLPRSDDPNIQPAPQDKVIV